MEIIISVFLGIFLTAIGIVGYVRISKDYEEERKNK